MFDRSAYQAHEALAGPARGKAQLWRLAMGLVLIAGVFLISYQFVEQTLFMLLGPAGFAALTGADGRASQLSVLFLLFSFGLIILSVLVALRVAHNRGFLEVLGPPRLLFRQFFSVLAMIVLLYAVLAILPPWDMGAPLKPNVSFGAWLLVLPFALAAVLVQVSAEEILFRGYLQQQLAARFSSPLIWIFVPSALFGAGHYAPQTGDLAGVIALWSMLFGLAMADLTARAGTLGPAIALHLMNNAVAILFVSMPDSLSGLSLYHSPFDLSDDAMVRAWLPVEFMMILVCWLAARLAIRR
ncbi:MAG: type II CAAX endopeptidase family protein [Pseudomonadota bacterium]